jgi:hypothetical protein
MIKIIIAAIVVCSLLAPVARADCVVAFNCGHGRATINGKAYPIVCGRLTGRGIDGGIVGHLIRANGRWRPGLVAPGTPMITTSPQLCYDCFIHVSGLRFSNGCLGTTGAAFNALKACGGSRFSITSN